MSPEQHRDKVATLREAGAVWCSAHSFTWLCDQADRAAALDGIANPAALPGLIAACEELQRAETLPTGQLSPHDAWSASIFAALAELHRQPREEAGG